MLFSDWYFYLQYFFFVLRLSRQVELAQPERRPEEVLPLAGNQREERPAEVEVLRPWVMRAPRREEQHTLAVLTQRYPSLEEEEVTELLERALVLARETLREGALVLHL